MNVSLTSHVLKRLLVLLLSLYVVAFYLGPMLLGGHKELAHYFSAALSSLNAPQTTYIIRNDYAALAQADALQAGIPPDLFVRQIKQESGFDPNSVSPAGAEGIAQFMPSTAAGLGIDPWDPVQSLQGAAGLMGRYYRNYGSYPKALAAYNGGSGTLQYCMNNYGDNWLSCEPSETQHYVYVIMHA
jgi:soluble lytic murein transglycosylase-like protein